MSENKVPLKLNLTFFDPSNIDRATVFLSRLVEQLCSCLVQPLYTCTQKNLLLTYSGQIRVWSDITFILTIDQSHVLELTQTTRERDKGTKRDLANRILGLPCTSFRVGQKIIKIIFKKSHQNRLLPTCSRPSTICPSCASN